MDILFQNNYKRSKALSKELYKRLYFTRAFAFILYTTIILAVLSQIALIVFMKSNNFLPIIIGLALVILYLAVYFIRVGVMVRRDKKMGWRDANVEVIVTDSFIKHSLMNNQNNVEFENVKKVIQTKNLIFLHPYAHVIFVFRKDSFVLGYKDYFIDFLESKGIEVKGK